MLKKKAKKKRSSTPPLGPVAFTLANAAHSARSDARERWPAMKTYCEMCGHNDGLEIANDPVGNLKTLCDQCRGGSILLLEAKMRRIAGVLGELSMSLSDDAIESKISTLRDIVIGKDLRGIIDPDPTELLQRAADLLGAAHDTHIWDGDTTHSAGFCGYCLIVHNIRRFLGQPSEYESRVKVDGEPGLDPLHPTTRADAPGEGKIPETNPTVKALADHFETILQDQDNPLCQPFWDELEKRGWDMEQTQPGTLTSSLWSYEPRYSSAERKVVIGFTVRDGEGRYIASPIDEEDAQKIVNAVNRGLSVK